MPPANPAPFVPRGVPESAPSSELPRRIGWHRDPEGRHESRCFDGVAWTDHVLDGKSSSTDAFSR